MHLALALLAGSSVTPIPVPTVDPELVTPGPWGFGIIVFVTVAVILLAGDMTRRIRRARVRADIQDELDAEQAQQDGDDGERGERDGQAL